MTSSFSLRLANNHLKQLQKPCVMGVINMSPNSFFQPLHSLDSAITRVANMIEAGASIIDVGGIATNPNLDLKHSSPSVQQQIDRTAMVIEKITERFEVLVSVDTSEPLVMRAAVASGAHIINDQRGLSLPNALETAVLLKVPVCLMHWFNPSREAGVGDPSDLFHQIKNDMREMLNRCLVAGLPRDRIILDPGFGGGNYGKTADENFYILARFKELHQFQVPLLIGWSRKSMLGAVLGGVPPEQRLYASIAAATIAGLYGAAIIRVHDVKETEDALRVIRTFNHYSALVEDIKHDA